METPIDDGINNPGDRNLPPSAVRLGLGTLFFVDAAASGEGEGPRLRPRDG